MDPVPGRHICHPDPDGTPRRRPTATMALAAALAALALVALALVALALALPVTAHEEHDGLHLRIREAEGETWFVLADRPGERNPDILVSEGQEVLIDFMNHGQRVHAVAIADPVGRQSEEVPPGSSTLLAFTVPAGAPARFAYFCPIHGTEGHFVNVDAPAPSEGSPLPWQAALVALGVAVLLRNGRR